MTDTRKIGIFCVLLILVSLGLTDFSVADLSQSEIIANDGTIIYWPRVDLFVNTSRIVGMNNLSLGFMLDFDWKIWRDTSALRSLAQNAGFKLVRLFDFRKSPRLTPCTSWNESTRTGTWDWTDADLLIQRIFEVGAEPIFALGSGGSPMTNFIPAGMSLDPSTQLPYPASWAAYCKEYPKHFKSIGLPVRYYEIINEPWMYFGWDDYAKLGNFMTLFNAVAQAMRAEDPSILLGFDGANRKPVLEYWLTNGGADLGFISFHKYDAGEIGQYSDSVMLDRAETYQLVTSSSYYGVKEARQRYYAARGKWIPVINSESNFNSACETGTDPRIQQMVGAVWEALVLRTLVLEGAHYNVYYHFASSATWERSNKPSGGIGFGMINSDNNQPWYPYYVQKMIGQNLGVGDMLIESISSSSSLKVLAWIHDGSTTMIIISKTQQRLSVLLDGISGQANVAKIDDSVSWETPQVQTSTINLTTPIEVAGYSVILVNTI